MCNEKNVLIPDASSSTRQNYITMPYFPFLHQHSHAVKYNCVNHFDFLSFYFILTYCVLVCFTITRQTVNCCVLYTFPKEINFLKYNHQIVY